MRYGYAYLGDDVAFGRYIVRNMKSERPNIVITVRDEKYLVGFALGRYTGYDGFLGSPIYKVRKTGVLDELHAQKRLDEMILFVDQDVSLNYKTYAIGKAVDSSTKRVILDAANHELFIIMLKTIKKHKAKNEIDSKI